VGSGGRQGTHALPNPCRCSGPHTTLQPPPPPPPRPAPRSPPVDPQHHADDAHRLPRLGRQEARHHHDPAVLVGARKAAQLQHLGGSVGAGSVGKGGCGWWKRGGVGGMVGGVARGASRPNGARAGAEATQGRGAWDGMVYVCARRGAEPAREKGTLGRRTQAGAHDPEVPPGGGRGACAGAPTVCLAGSRIAQRFEKNVWASGKGYTGPETARSRAVWAAEGRAARAAVRAAPAAAPGRAAPEGSRVRRQDF
jgi:hypothetical protein